MQLAFRVQRVTRVLKVHRALLALRELREQPDLRAPPAFKAFKDHKVLPGLQEQLVRKGLRAYKVPRERSDPKAPRVLLVSQA